MKTGCKTLRSATLATLTLLALALTVRADETIPVLKVGSETYSNVTVMNVTATDLYFRHSAGMGNVKLKNLSPDLQQQFHYNPAKASNQEKQQITANAQYRQGLTAKKAPAASPAKNRNIPVQDDGLPDPVAPRLSAKSFRGGRAPRLIVNEWLTEKPDFAGKFILVDFWATWCGPCRQSIPHMNDLYGKFSDRMVVVGLSDEPLEVIRKMKSPRMDYPVGTDTQARTKDLVGVEGIPHTILIDPNGFVRYEGHPGYLDAKGLSRLLARYGTPGASNPPKTAKAK